MENEKIFIRISKDDFIKSYQPHEWLVFERTLEKRFDKEGYQFDFNVNDYSLIIYVRDLNDALWLSSRLQLIRFVFFDGNTSKIIPCDKKPKRMRKPLIENADGQRLKIQEFKKQTADKNDLILRSEVIKRGIFTRPQLEKLFQKGELVAVDYGGKIYINRHHIKEYIMRKK